LLLRSDEEAGQRTRRDQWEITSAAQILGGPVDSDRRAIVAAVLRKMDSKIREIGVLHHLNGMTQEEVAENTGYSRRTVGKKLKSFEELFKKHFV